NSVPIVSGMEFLSEARLIARHGNFENGCCSKNLGWFERSGGMLVKAGLDAGNIDGLRPQYRCYGLLYFVYAS
ncbi:hypothetical protein AVEN_73479-1, partial [Araneus ventricosus]